MADAATSLALDIQRALQEAVGNANDAAHLSDKKKKKKRRSKEIEPAEGDRAEDGEKKRKRRKKRHDAQEDRLAEQSDATPAQTIEPSETVVLGGEKKKRKKKKGKHRAEHPTATQTDAPPDEHADVQGQPAVQPTEQISQTNNDLAASNADFLSAVVAAASATSHIHQQAPGYQPPVPPFAPFPDQYSSYPPSQFPYPPPPFGGSHLPSIFSDLDLSLVSSEDLLRELQDLDITKLASVLKTLGEAGAPGTGISVNNPPAFVPPPPPPGPPPINQITAKSDAILGRPPKQVKASGQSTRTLGTPRTHAQPTPGGDEGNPDHAHILANVWMSATKLAELAKEQGLVYKKGKFSTIEEAQLKTAIENYRLSKGLTAEELTELIFTRDKSRDAFWAEITSALYLRPIISVYHHVRRMWHPLRAQGKWMPCEDDALRSAIAQFGQQWEKVSQYVGRTGQDCRDRWRNHLEEKGARNTGPWTKEEEEELTHIVTEMTIQQGKDVDSEIFWGIVSKLMGGRRGKQQCRIKWLDTLSGKFKNEGKQVRWSQLDAYILVHKIDSLNVHDDSEIDWKKLPDEHWNTWSPHTLQRRWVCMKRSVKGHDDMTHAELIDILRTKKAQSPPPPTTRPHKKITSAETIVDSDDEDIAIPGSSTGPGTALDVSSA